MSRRYSRNRRYRSRQNYKRNRSRNVTMSYRQRRKITVIVVVAILLLILALIIVTSSIRHNRNEENKANVSSTSAISSSKQDDSFTMPSETTTQITTSTSNIPAFVQTAFAAAGADATYAASHPYCIAVNTVQNEVIVYSRAADGTYSQPFKAMVASCGKAESPTKTGTFKTVEKYTWRALNGGVFGQYATRIDGPYLFHSVPYYSQSPDSLETEEYNHLGENRSLGCVRLAVADCKWIYDNCPIGTIVTLYADSSVQEPLTKPTSKQIPSTGEKSGWDPTDPNPNNPWNS